MACRNHRAVHDVAGREITSSRIDGDVHLRSVDGSGDPERLA
jgi:hypothetical protein